MRLVPDRAMLRALARSPVFTVVAVLSLALAIGVTTTAYSIVDAVEHPPVIGDDPGHTFGLFGTGMDRDRKYHFQELYAALYAHRGLFRSFAAYSPEWTTVIAAGQPVWAQVMHVSANFFDVLGVVPAIGQGFRPADADHPAAAGALLGYAMWRRVYGGAPLTGLTVTVGDETYPVEGVLPPEMDGETNGTTSSLVWVRMPRAGVEQGRGMPFFVSALVRTKPGQSVAQMAQQLAAIVQPFADEYGIWPGYPLVYAIRPSLPRPGKVTEIHKALAAAALVVLLIACANVANLLVARVISRQRDIAVRMAVGASGYDVARYVIGEAGVLAAVGGAGGILLSLWGMHFVEYQIGADVTGLSGLVPHLSWRVLLFSIGLSAGTVLLIAWGAVLRARRTNVNEAMKNGTAATTHRSGRLYRWLVVTELAMSLVVLMGAALLLRAVSAVRGFQFGYDPARVVYANINKDPWPELHDQSAHEARFAGLLAGVREIRGVRAAAWMNSAMPEGEILTSDVGGADPKQLFMRSYMVGSPGLLTLLGVKLVKGRDFEAGDAASSGVAIVDDSTAAALWPHMSPLGHLVKLGTESGNAQWVRVIGVARTVSLSFESDPDMGPLPTIYVAGAGRLGDTRRLVIRTDRAEGAAMLGVLRYLRGVLPGPNQPHFQSWTQGFGQEIRERQSVAFLFQMIGLFALVLSTIGVYGTLAYTGAQRTREFAMRIALGAQPRDVWRLVVDEALLLVLGGTAVGGFAAMWAASSIERLLYTVSPVDAVALVTAEAILVGTSLAASVGPALRATRADPVDLLRAT